MSLQTAFTSSFAGQPQISACKPKLKLNSNSPLRNNNLLPFKNEKHKIANSKKRNMQTSRVSRVLPLLVALVLSAPLSSANLIEKACKLAEDEGACVETIKSFPESANATVPELAIIVLKLASEKVANVTIHINTLLSNSSSVEPTVYQRIDECSVQFQDAIDMVDNSMAALSVNKYDDVAKFLTIAVADADACEDGIKSVGSKDLVSELSKFDQAFKRLCHIALAISKVAKAMN